MSTSNLNKLICSLRSDLFNEIDFGLQIATILANTDNFSWSEHYQLIEAICSSLHVYTCVCKDDDHVCYCYPRFWHRMLADSIDNESLQAATLPPDMKLPFLNFKNLQDHDIEEHQKIYKRVKKVAELLGQFSMTCSEIAKIDQPIKPNYNYNYYQVRQKKQQASPILLRFVSLLLFCNDTSLSHVGLQIASNIASKLSKIPDTPEHPECAKLIQMFHEHVANSIIAQDGDIYVIIRSFEVISRLIATSNKTVLSHIIHLIQQKKIVVRIEELLTSNHDVTLFSATLECCHQIAKNQPQLLTASGARYLIKILVNLLNCNERSYFTQTALQRVKLTDEAGYEAQTQSPLGVSVRLTAALILRNLAIHSQDVRLALDNHQRLLSEICMSEQRDEAKIIAECLSLLTKPT